MKIISNKDIQDYSNSEDFEYVDTIGGTLPKGFVRLDNKYLKNYLKEAIKPGCKYVTHIDDFVRETYDLKRKNIPLKYVSASETSQETTPKITDLTPDEIKLLRVRSMLQLLMLK